MASQKPGQSMSFDIKEEFTVDEKKRQDILQRLIKSRRLKKPSKIQPLQSQSSTSSNEDNGSEASFHSLSSNETFVPEASIECGDFVADIQPKYLSSGKKLSVKQIKDMIFMISSANIKVDRKISVLKTLEDIEFDFNLVEALIRWTNDSSNFLEIIIHSVQEYAKEKSDKARNVVQGSLNILKKILMTEGSCRFTCFIFEKLSKNEGIFLKTLLSFLDPLEGCSISKEGCKQISNYFQQLAKEEALTGIFFELPGDLIRALQDFSSFAHIADSSVLNKSPTFQILLKENIGLMTAQVFNEDGVYPLENILITKFKDKLSPNNVDHPGIVKNNARPIFIRELLPSGYCIFFSFSEDIVKQKLRIMERKITNEILVESPIDKDNLSPGKIVSVDSVSIITPVWEEFEFARGMVLEQFRAADRCLLWLVDHGQLVTTASEGLFELPKSLEKSSYLAKLGKLQGITGNPNPTLKIVSAEVLSMILKISYDQFLDFKHLCGGELIRISSTLFEEDQIHFHRVASVLLRKIVDTKKNMEYPTDRDFCLKVFKILRKYASTGCSDIIENCLNSLFFLMNRLGKMSFQFIVENTDIKGLMSELETHDSLTKETKILIGRIKAMPSEGNKVLLTTQNKKIYIQREILLKKRRQEQRLCYNGEPIDNETQTQAQCLKIREKEPFKMGIAEMRREISINLGVNPIPQENLNAESDQKPEIINRIRELQQEKRRHQMIKIDSFLEERPNHIFLRHGQDQFQLGGFIVGLLNREKMGRIIIGVEENGKVKGLRMSRKEKDHYRQGFDRFYDGKIITPMVPNSALTLNFNPVFDNTDSEVGEILVVVCGSPITGQQRHRYKLCYKDKAEALLWNDGQLSKIVEE